MGSIAAGVRVALLAAALQSAAWAQEAVTAEPVPAMPAEEAPERIVITGQRPGPGMWKVSKDDHVLWVFGTYGPLPKDLVWHSRQAETRLAESQELIHPGGAFYRPSLFRIITLLPSAIGAKNNPDGGLLRDRVAPEVYQRWLALKAKYLGDNSEVEKMRPYFAAQILHNNALRRIGLDGRGQVDTRIAALAKQHKLKVTRPTFKLEIDDPGAKLRQFKKTPMDDAACFGATLERLESDIEAMRQRADAWARGDLETFRSIRLAGRDSACNEAFKSAIPEEFHGPAVRERIKNAWLDAALAALQANKSTFALLPLDQMTETDGLLAALRERGYRVESPE